MDKGKKMRIKYLYVAIVMFLVVSNVEARMKFGEASKKLETKSVVKEKVSDGYQIPEHLKQLEQELIASVRRKSGSKKMTIDNIRDLGKKDIRQAMKYMEKYDDSLFGDEMKEMLKEVDVSEAKKIFSDAALGKDLLSEFDLKTEEEVLEFVASEEGQKKMLEWVKKNKDKLNKNVEQSFGVSADELRDAIKIKEIR